MRQIHLGSKPDKRGFVVTPNKAAAGSRGVVSVTLETLARQALPEGTIASPTQSRQFLMTAVREVLGDCDTIGFARFFGPAVRELLRLNADLEQVASCGGRLGRLAAVAQAFRRLLGERGLIDAAQIFFEAARVVEGRQVTVTGYPRLGLGELVFLDALAMDGSQLVLPYAEDALFTENAEAAVFLEARGWTTVREPARQVWQVDVPAEALYFPNQEAEVRGVLARVKLLLDEGVAPDDISLIVRDEALYGPLILGVAREYGIEVAAYYALPLKNTRVGSFVVAFMTMLEDAYGYKATTRFLAHPLTDRLDSDLWAKIRAAHPQRLKDWGVLGLELPRLPGFATRDEFLEVLAEFWDAFELKLPREQAALASLKTSLGSLDGSTRLSRDTFLTQLDDVLHSLTVAVKPGRGVSVHTPLAVLGAELEHVFALGLAEGVFPPDLHDDAALDYFERRALRAGGIPIETAPYAAWRERLSFHSLVSGVKTSLMLSYPEQLSNQLVEPSDYFERLGLTPQPSARTYAVSEQEVRRVDLLEHSGLGTQGFEVEAARETIGLFDEFDGVTGLGVNVSDHEFSATQLTHLLSCPFKWFAAYVLKAGGLAELEEDALLTGNLYHKTLELLVYESEGQADVRESMLDNLEAAFAAAEAALNVPDLPAWPAKRLEYLAVLRKAIAAPAFMVEGARTVKTEHYFSATWQGFKVRGRIDRLDETPDGLLITDYKTSSYVSTPDVQLLIYEAAAREQHPEKEAATRYFSLKKADVLPQKTPEDLAERLGRAKEALETGVFPPVASEENCAYCKFDPLCRKGPRLKGKTLRVDL